jgi:allophanate hydrolase
MSAARERALDCAQPAWISFAPDCEEPPAGRLAGMEFAVKDNIDVAGLATTAACPAFAYMPERSAHVVSRLVSHGAVPVGKTNMDQFATGLTGTRTPHGACWSTVESSCISGGSSSGSAVAVAEGHVPFALGTDTAGSGRVPAAFNEIVGLRPTFGRISLAGVVPACRTLDTVSVFAPDVATTATVFACAAGADPDDPFSRRVEPLPLAGERPRIATAPPGALGFAGDVHAERAYLDALERASALGWELHMIDPAPLLAAGALLYEGPWLAERTVAFGDFLQAHPGEVDEVVASIVAGGTELTAADAFRGVYALAQLRAQVDTLVWGAADALLLPTAPTIYTHAEIAADPVGRNAVLGRFTNCAGLLDLAAIAVPGTRRDDGRPFGVSLLAPAGGDERLLALAAEFCAERPPAHEGITVAVVGAHLSGQPLNGQLTGRGARLLETCRTAPHYRLYALAGGALPRPGLVAADAAGPGIEVELWSLSAAALGELTAAVMEPLAIGRVELEDGRTVSGFVCEPRGLEGASEITHLGGWRAHVEATRVP